MRNSLLALSLVLAASAFAQHDMPSQSAKPVVIESGLGNFHRPVSTKNAQAQRFFDQGMKYLYGFNHESAVASFQRATQLDPNLAIGYWGPRSPSDRTSIWTSIRIARSRHTKASTPRSRTIHTPRPKNAP
jgi:hypothetical protein